jgi:thiamine biosynthesis lipoprotein
LIRSGERVPPGALLLILGLSLVAAIMVRVFSYSGEVSENPLTEHGRTVPALGTFASMIIIADESLATEIFLSADSMLNDLDRELGFLGDGSLYRLNEDGACRLTPAPGMVAAHPWLTHLVYLSAALHPVTNGYFDPSVGALVTLWGWPAEPSLPDSTVVDSVLAFTGWESVELTPDSVLLPEGMSLDFGGVAKGYAADMLYEMAMEMGASGALIEIGGEVRCGSVAGLDRTWRIAVRHPRETGFWDTFELEGGAVATSGDYENFFFSDGTRYTHLLDPHTGWPSGATVSVTVAAARCDIADALATAVAVGGIEIVSSLPDSLYVFIVVLTEDESGEVTEWSTGGTM